jgi:cell division protein FtsZ
MGLMESYTTTIMGAGIDEMSDIIEVEAETNEELVGAPRIMVVGAGGAGNNSVSLLSQMGIKGAEIIAVNTDLQALKIADANKRILIGKSITRGRGAGGDPDTAARCMKASQRAFESLFNDVNLVFVIAGMGGGTGTGSAPVIAEIAKSQGAIVIGIVTMPFNVERERRTKAKIGARALRKIANSTIILDNNKLLHLVGNRSISTAFSMIDKLIAEIIIGVTETITEPSLINLDFADLKSVMSSGGTATILYGEASSLDPETIIHNTINNPMYKVNYKEVTGALIHITSGTNLTLKNTEVIANGITKEINKKVEVIIGARLDPSLQNRIKVMAILTGVDKRMAGMPAQNAPVNMKEIRKRVEVGFSPKSYSKWDIPLVR